MVGIYFFCLGCGCLDWFGSSTTEERQVGVMLSCSSLVTGRRKGRGMAVYPSPVQVVLFVIVVFCHGTMCSSVSNHKNDVRNNSRKRRPVEELLYIPNRFDAQILFLPWLCLVAVSSRCLPEVTLRARLCFFCACFTVERTARRPAWQREQLLSGGWGSLLPSGGVAGATMKHCTRRTNRRSPLHDLSIDLPEQIGY